MASVDQILQHRPQLVRTGMNFSSRLAEEWHMSSEMGRSALGIMGVVQRDIGAVDTFRPTTYFIELSCRHE